MAEILELDVASRLYPQLALDTTVLINDWNGARGVIRGIPPGARRAGLVTFWEFLRGEGGGRLAAEKRRDREAWLDGLGIVVVPFSAGFDQTLRSMVKRSDHPSSVADGMIAADCLSRGWPLVTANRRDFEPVDGLRLVLA